MAGARCQAAEEHKREMSVIVVTKPQPKRLSVVIADTPEEIKELGEDYDSEEFSEDEVGVGDRTGPSRCGCRHRW